MSFGIVVLYPKSTDNYGTLFRSAQNFGASFLSTVGARFKIQSSDTQKSWRHVPTFNFSCWKDFIDHAPVDWIPVAVEICEGASSLHNFQHPKSCFYIFGPEDSSIPPDILMEISRKVFIPSIRCLNLAVAGSIVIYDRIAKENKNLNPIPMKTTFSKGQKLS